MEGDKKFNEENLNYCSVNLFTFKILRNVKTLKSFFSRGYSVPSQISNKEFLKKRHVLNTLLYFQM